MTKKTFFVLCILSLMLSTLNAAALIGIDALMVTVEANVAGGIPSFTVVGLPTITTLALHYH